jgi:hypothetical protein
VFPLVVYVALHIWLTDSPPVKVQLAVQPVIGALPAFTVTVDWKPPFHELDTEHAELASMPAWYGSRSSPRRPWKTYLARLCRFSCRFRMRLMARRYDSAST